MTSKATNYIKWFSGIAMLYLSGTREKELTGVEGAGFCHRFLTSKEDFTYPGLHLTWLMCQSPLKWLLSFLVGGEGCCPSSSMLARICSKVPAEGGAWVCYFGYRFVLYFLKAEGSNGSRIPRYTALYSSLLSSSLKYIAAFYGFIIMSLSYSLIL